MGAVLFNLTTAALMVLMFKAGQALIGEGPLRQRRVPWAAVGITGLALAGVVTQLCWAGAMDALDSDPARTGWWRVFTATFMQNGGVGGAAWNIATLAVIAALADWFWGAPLTLGLLLAGILLPEHIDALIGLGGDAGRTDDARNFAGSSGATYFLAATLAAALLLRAVRALRAGGEAGASRKDALLAAAVPVAGLALWLAQSNGHGLVTVYGFAVGALVGAVARRGGAPREAGAGAAA